METNEFSFVLRPNQYGIGVYSIINIKEGTKLNLFGKNEQRPRTLEKNRVPKEFWDICIDLGSNKVLCPNDFSRIELGWFLNHSKNPNASHKNLDWYAKKDISKNEEILINYNSLEEPQELRDEYYN